MIDRISIANVATYGATPEVLNGLSLFNFIFGSNATGKTTISRVIANENAHPTCTVTWKAGTKLQPMVYNSDFVDRSFHQVSQLKGVFTLGEKQVGALEKISATKAEVDALSTKIENLNQSLLSADQTSGKRAELAALESKMEQKCWAQKQKHDAILQGAFTGYRASAEKFKAKVLDEQGTNVAALLALTVLETKAGSIFGPTPKAEPVIPAVDTATILAHENQPILKKRIIGKDDVDIAAMIKKLGNSDWVRQGLPFYEANEKVCPFCQQSTEEALAQSLKDYFDDSFVADTKTIETLATDYSTDAARLQQSLASVISSPSRFLDVEKLKIEKDLLDTKVLLNLQHLDKKKKESSQVIELESLSNILTAIETLINSANTQIATHNEMVSNLATEKQTLTAQVWRFVIEELKIDLAAYKAEKEGLTKAITAMSTQIGKLSEEMRTKEAVIRGLEKQTTSIQPTIDGINQLLTSFGFQSFKLAKTASGDAYKLVRADGTDAKTTLSEGEKNFVTFLYFFHLLKGNDSDSGMTTDRIVVFDDPVSSLDSDILFIVSSLIKDVSEEVRAGTGYIKQVFVLTHNVYFHKEVTYSRRRPNGGILSEETFHIVKKPAMVSKLERQTTNPIKTSYELLWAEVRKPDLSSLTIQNTLRRILESYFRILGGIEINQLCTRFEGREKTICKSLCSWVHDGSHNAHDDLFVSIDASMVESYLKVFRAIFQRHGHIEHYKMMMGDAFVEEPPTSTSSATIPASAPSAALSTP